MTKRKKTKTCRWFAGSTKAGYEVACLIPKGPRGTGRPRGTPKRWKFAFGPYTTKSKAIQTARYQNYGDAPKILKRLHR